MASDERVERSGEFFFALNMRLVALFSSKFGCHKTCHPYGLGATRVATIRFATLMNGREGKAAPPRR